MAADMMGIPNQTRLMNAAAFAPIPIMLIIFNLMTRKWGAKVAFRSPCWSLLSPCCSSR